MATGLANMTKEEKDEMVRKKMEDMKKKSEEILKRHLQIEADKRNADMYSKAVIEKKKNNPAPPEVPKEKRVPNRQNSRPQLIARMDSREIEEKRKQRLSDRDAPPPDPNFNFLSDPLRKNEEFENEAIEQGFRHKNNFGGEDFQNVKTSIKEQRNYTKEHPMSPPKNKMEMALQMTGKERRDYENWRKEREQIDKERIARQKTSEGTFKREWDNDKIIPDLNEAPERKPDEYYKSAQWSKDGDKSGNSGRFRDSQFSSPEWDEDESAKQNRFSRSEARRSFGDKYPRGGLNEKPIERTNKPPLYPGWEPKRNIDNYAKGEGGFKKWENEDGRVGRRSDAPSWRAGDKRSDSFHSKGDRGRGRGHRSFKQVANNTSSMDDESWREVNQDDVPWRDVQQDEVPWRDVQKDNVAWTDVKQGNGSRKTVKQDDGSRMNFKPNDGAWRKSKPDEVWRNNKQDDDDWSDTRQDDVEWRNVKQDDIEWDIDPHNCNYIKDNKKDNLEDFNSEEEVDLSSVKNFVIQCKGEKRQVQVEHGMTPFETQEESKEGEEDDWEDVSSEEEELKIGGMNKRNLTYDNLRMTVKNEVRKETSS